MLNCILGMVDKTKRALSILQQRNASAAVTPANLHKTSRTNYNNGTNLGNTLSGSSSNAVNNAPPTSASSGYFARIGGTSSFASAIDGLMARNNQNGAAFSIDGGVDPLVLGSKVPVSDMLAATLRSTEERVAEVRRRAEEAVLEVYIYKFSC